MKPPTDAKAAGCRYDSATLPGTAVNAKYLRSRSRYNTILIKTDFISRRWSAVDRPCGKESEIRGPTRPTSANRAAGSRSRSGIKKRKAVMCLRGWYSIPYSFLKSNLHIASNNCNLEKKIHAEINSVVRDCTRFIFLYFIIIITLLSIFLYIFT